MKEGPAKKYTGNLLKAQEDIRMVVKTTHENQSSDPKIK